MVYLTMFVLSFFEIANGEIQKGTKFYNYLNKVSYAREKGRYRIVFRDNTDRKEKLNYILKITEEDSSGWRVLKDEIDVERRYSSIPVLRFYDNPSFRGDVKVKISEEGFYHNGEMKCKPKHFLGYFTYFCINDLVKSDFPSGYSSPYDGSIYIFFDFDKILEGDILQTTYKGEKLYLDLKSIEKFKKVKATSDFIPSLREIGKLSDVYEGYYWIIKPSKYYRSKFKERFPRLKERAEKAVECVENKNYKCLGEVLGGYSVKGVVNTFFKEVYQEYYGSSSNKSIGEWVFESPGFRESLISCLSEGRVTSFYVGEEGSDFVDATLKMRSPKPFYRKDENGKEDCYYKVVCSLSGKYDKNEDGRYEPAGYTTDPLDLEFHQPHYSCGSPPGVYSKILE